MRRRAWARLVAPVAAVGALAGAVTLVRSGSDTPASAPPRDAAIDAWEAVDAVLDAPVLELDAPLLVVVDAAAAPRDAAAVADAPRRAVPRDAALQDEARTAAVARVAFTIGAVPWAHFTVDNDPTSYETPTTLPLAVGAHRVTFTNPALGTSRTVTIEVTEDGPPRHVEKMR